MAAIRSEGVDVVVSMLTKDESEDLGLAEEEQMCVNSGMMFMNFPIEDRSVPRSTPEARQLIQELAGHLQEERSIGIHCRAGIGRSALMVASVLVISGISVGKAFELVKSARGCDVPDTNRQREWVEQFERASGAPA
jgi:protein-tyrosine phosphatase